MLPHCLGSTCHPTPSYPTSLGLCEAFRAACNPLPPPSLYHLPHRILLAVITCCTMAFSQAPAPPKEGGEGRREEGGEGMTVRCRLVVCRHCRRLTAFWPSFFAHHAPDRQSTLSSMAAPWIPPPLVLERTQAPAPFLEWRTGGWGDANYAPTLDRRVRPRRVRAPTPGSGS